MKALRQRAALYQAVRSFFYGRGYLEVETPQLLPTVIPEENIAPWRWGDLFLQASPELAMKRLLARGEEAIFQICKCFRPGERGRLHLPEFTMLEWYRTGDDYQGLMTETEEFFRWLAGSLSAETGFSQPALDYLTHGQWQRLTVAEAFARYGSMAAEAALQQDCFDEILVAEVEPRLGQDGPCLLYDYPLPLASLARVKESDPTLAERFELYMLGIELANGFSELTDASVQRQRFVKAATDLQLPLPELFLADLDNLDQACGIALGLDRVLMVLCGAECIDQVVSFTQDEL